MEQRLLESQARIVKERYQGYILLQHDRLEIFQAPRAHICDRVRAFIYIDGDVHRRILKCI